MSNDKTNERWNEHTVITEGTSLQGLGGGLQLLAALAEGLLTVVDPALHMGCEHLSHAHMVVHYTLCTVSPTQAAVHVNKDST